MSLLKCDDLQIVVDLRATPCFIQYVCSEAVEMSSAIWVRCFRNLYGNRKSLSHQVTHNDTLIVDVHEDQSIGH